MFLGATLFFVFSFYGLGEANSFPFRSVKVGDKLPVITVRDIGTQQDANLEQFSGKPLLMVFFGADVPAKKKRSVKVLKAIHSLASFAEARDVAIVVVNAQGDSADVITEVVSAAGLAAKVYMDVDRRAYGSLGVFVMPSILLVAADGTIGAGLGYSRDLAKRLKVEIEIMLGEKTRAQVEEEQWPKVVEKSAAEKGAARHFKLGMTMLERGRPESAMREFKKAVSIVPGMGKAHIQLGCLQLDGGKIAEAKASLVRGLELEPDLVAGQICQARVKAEEGAVADAIEDLGFIMLRNSRNDHLHYVLGKMLEKQADQAGALAEYRQAYELLIKKSRKK
jgi:tetratricopeptide (TPR) repeat protein